MERKRTYGVWAVRSSTSIFGPAQSWCKENGKPLEFDSKADAENYAKEANEHTTANVRYYVKEKEPEPGAVRKGTSQPELDARSHEEVIPRNDAAEKQNEIPGRQIPSQTDPLVEIRSAVHSNYAGMVAMLGADNRVYLGREERCHYCPLTLKQIFQAKVWASFLLSMLVSVISFAAMFLVIETELFFLAGRLLIPSVSWLVVILLLSPAISLIAITLIVRGSAKAQSVEESQQAAVFLILPVILPIAGQFTGVFLMNVWILLGLGVICAILAWFLLQKSMGRFTYEKLLQ